MLYFAEEIGAGEGIRTLDPDLGKVRDRRRLRSDLGLTQGSAGVLETDIRCLRVRISK